MKKGLLITNGFVGEQSFIRLWDSLLTAAKKRSMSLEAVSHDKLLFDSASGAPLWDADDVDFAILWDKDVRLGYQLEKLGIRVFNPPASIEICDDKSLTHIALGGKLPMPPTVTVPITYKYVGYGDMEFLRRAADHLGLPLVIKECRGSFGKQVYLANTVKEAAEIIAAHEATPMLLQKAITESFGRDIRLYVAGEKVIAGMMRSNARDFRANIANGGQSEAYTPSADEAELAVSAVKLLGLDFAGVDILQSSGGPLICEVNSNAHFHGMESCTGVDVAGAIMDCIMNKVENQPWTKPLK